MIGERVFPNKWGHLRLPECGYGRDLQNRWWIRPLGEDRRQVPAALVTEHADGTITVTEGVNGSTRLILQRGVWEDAV